MKTAAGACWVLHALEGLKGLAAGLKLKEDLARRVGTFECRVGSRHLARDSGVWAVAGVLSRER